MPRPLLALAIAFGAGCFLGDASGRLGGLALAGLAAALLVLAMAAPNRRATGIALLAGALALGAAESVVGISDAFKPYPERRGLYRPNPVRTVRAGFVAMMPPALKVVASAAR
jgi:hypothetical protein